VPVSTAALPAVGTAYAAPWGSSWVERRGWFSAAGEAPPPALSLVGPSHKLPSPSAAGHGRQGMLSADGGIGRKAGSCVVGLLLEVLTQQAPLRGSKMFRPGPLPLHSQRWLLPRMRIMKLAASWQLPARDLHHDRWLPALIACGAIHLSGLLLGCIACSLMH